MSSDVTRRMRWWEWMRSENCLFPLGLFALLRAAYVSFSYMGLWIHNPLFEWDSDRHKDLQPYKAIDGLCRWDCSWFEIVGREGYVKLENAKVFPLFPLISHLAHDYLGMNRYVALILAANIASLLSYWVLFSIYRELSDLKSARWALLIFTAYPFSFFQAAGYPESTMVLMSALAIRCMMHKKPIWSGHALGIGIMSRHITVFGGAGMLAAHIRQSWPSPKKFFISWGFVGLLLPFAYVAAFSYYLKQVNGDALAFYHSRSLAWGPGVWYSVREIWQHEKFAAHPEYFFYQPFLLIPIMGTIGLFFRKNWLELAAASTILMITVVSTGGVGIGRYSAACWPAYLAIGVWISRRPRLQTPIYGVLMLLQGMFFWLFTHQFRIL
jgi:hypothetical protein